MKTRSLRIVLPVLMICATLLAYAHGYQAPAPIADCVCGDIVGRIVETSSGTPRPISGATATLDGSTVTSGTNSSGHFHFERVVAGGHSVKAEASGFSPVAQSVLVRNGELTDVGEITLARIAQTQQSGFDPFLIASPFVLGATAVAALAVGYFAGSRRRKEP